MLRRGYRRRPRTSLDIEPEYVSSALAGGPRDGDSLRSSSTPATSILLALFHAKLPVSQPPQIAEYAMSIELSMSDLLDAALERAAKDRISSLADAGEAYTLDEYVYARKSATHPGAQTIRVKNMRVLRAGSRSNWYARVTRLRPSCGC